MALETGSYRPRRIHRGCPRSMILRDEQSGEAIKTELALRDAAIESAAHPVDLLEPPEESAVSATVSRLAGVLQTVLAFMADGRRGGSFEVRAWVVLHQTRRDLLKGEDVDAFAARRGLEAQGVRKLITEFDELFRAARNNRAPGVIARTQFRTLQRYASGS